MNKRRKLRQLENEFTEENGDGVELNIRTFHQIANGELDPDRLNAEGKKRFKERIESFKEYRRKEAETVWKVKTMIKKQRLDNLEEELESEASQSTDAGPSEEELETYRERLEEGLRDGEEWYKDFSDINIKLEDMPRDLPEALKELPEEEKEAFIKACRKVYID